jgi:hypothetical protein
MAVRSQQREANMNVEIPRRPYRLFRSVLTHLWAWLDELFAEPHRADPFADLTEADSRLMEFSDHDSIEISASTAMPRSGPAGLISRVRRIPRGLLATFRDPDFSPIEARPLVKPQVMDYSNRHSPEL